MEVIQNSMVPVTTNQLLFLFHRLNTQRLILVDSPICGLTTGKIKNQLLVYHLSSHYQWEIQDPKMEVR